MSKFYIAFILLIFSAVISTMTYREISIVKSSISPKDALGKSPDKAYETRAALKLWRVWIVGSQKMIFAFLGALTFTIVNAGCIIAIYIKHASVK